ncbi:MAG: hypothetical protein SVZ03_16255 [Spirochaetota bacterium]|nr:hypothetical protein [Spirochaetota bacterium]
MSILLTRLKDIQAFIYILIFLLIFNIGFNLYYDWYGISLIVRMYLFVFSFYLIFNFSSVETYYHKEKYENRYGKRGGLLLFLELRIFPFILIYIITIIFTFIDYIREPNWPWNPILSLLNGRYSNLVIYSLLLLLILKLKRRPSITIPLFLFVSILYFISDKIIYSTITCGTAITAIKALKSTAFLYLLFYEFFRKPIRPLLYSIAISIFIFFSIIVFLSTVFKYSNTLSYQKKESGLLLLRFGYTSPIQELKDIVIEEMDFHLFQNLLVFANKYEIDIEYNKSKWEDLLFLGTLNMTDFISGYILNKNIDISYKKIVSYAHDYSQKPNTDLESALFFIKLSSKYLDGNEIDFYNRLNNSNKKFKLWGIAVLAELKSIESIPLLLEFLTDIDIKISMNAYKALKRITGLDPDNDNKLGINDPETIIAFKKYYLMRHNKG